MVESMGVVWTVVVVVKALDADEEVSTGSATGPARAPAANRMMAPLFFIMTKSSVKAT